MRTTIPYADDQERAAVLTANAGMYLVEDRRHEDGNYLVFDDTPADEEGVEFRKLTLANLTPDDVDAYIDSNVTDLASARAVLKLYGKAVLWLAKKNRIV